ncbi:hypothetical protein ABZ621_21745 [Streptomyces sp. NPDC007863]|uniref:hypothetical protein n=1 Tax=Streptomyces sp. NPDC007863 TaxID=3154894 RepID=UPI0033EA33A6
MPEAGGPVVTLARWLGHSSSAITLGYAAHSCRSRQQGTWHHRQAAGGAGETGSSAETPQIPRAPSTADSCLCIPEESSVDCKAEEMGGLGNCWKRL